MIHAMSTSSVERVFSDLTMTGLALAAGASISSMNDESGRLEFKLAGVPADFDRRHMAGEIMVSTLDAQRYVDQIVKLVRTKAKFRDRRKMYTEREALWNRPLLDGK